MSAVVFLLAALFLATTGSLILWLKFRNPSTLEHSIQSFQREMRALAPDPSKRLPFKKPGDDDADDPTKAQKTETEAAAATARTTATETEAEAHRTVVSGVKITSEKATPGEVVAPAETGDHVAAAADGGSSTDEVADEVEPAKPSKISLLHKFLSYAAAPAAASAEPASEAHPAPVAAKVSLERVAGRASAATPKVSLERVVGRASAATPKVSLERVVGRASATTPKVSLERQVATAVAETGRTADVEAAAAVVVHAVEPSEAPCASEASDAERAKVSLVREQPVRAVPQAAGGRTKSKPKSGGGKGGGPPKSNGKPAREREPQDR